MIQDWANGFMNSYANQLSAVNNPVREANKVLTEAARERKRLQAELGLAKAEDELYSARTQHEMSKDFSEYGIEEIRKQTRAVIPGSILDFGTWFGAQWAMQNARQKYTTEDTGSNFFSWLNNLNYTKLGSGDENQQGESYFPGWGG